MPNAAADKKTKCSWAQKRAVILNKVVLDRFHVVPWRCSIWSHSCRVQDIMSHSTQTDPLPYNLFRDEFKRVKKKMKGNIEGFLLCMWQYKPVMWEIVEINSDILLLPAFSPTLSSLTCRWDAWCCCKVADTYNGSSFSIFISQLRICHVPNWHWEWDRPIKQWWLQ